MTRDEISKALADIIDQQFGSKSFVLSGAKNLQEALMCTSLEIVSFQLAIEERFGLRFGTGPNDRSRIDEEWDALTGIIELLPFIEKWRGKQ